MHRNLAAPLLAGLAAALMAAGPAAAKPAPAHLPYGAYLQHRLNKDGRPGPIDGDPAHQAHVEAHILVPGAYRTIRTAPGAALTVLDRNSSTCSYTISFSARLRLAPATDATSHVTTDLPADPGPYLLDEGRRGRGAFRVIRDRTAAPTVHLSAELAIPVPVPSGSGIALPGGQSYWAELRAEALTTPGSVCHYGTYHATLGPQLADALATARVRPSVGG